MKKLTIITFILFFISCNEQTKITNTDIEVASQFIKAVQNNNKTIAEELLLNDETNINYLKKLLEQAKTNEPSSDDIIIYETKPVNDSITIFNYANSLKPSEKNKIKVIRINKQWQVDLKYTFSGNF